MLKESLERLWEYRYRGAMLNYLEKWMEQLKWGSIAESMGRIGDFRGNSRVDRRK
jgi:hypothetical protein